MNSDCFFNDIFVSNGFVRKGNCYFRIVGDNIFQCADYKYMPRFRKRVFSFGMISMYSPLIDDYFSSCGFEFSIYGIRVFGINDKEFDSFDSDRKIEIFKNTIMPRFNAVLTQNDLIDACDNFEINGFGTVLTNNVFRIEPYLKCGEYEKASEVIEAILHQHKNALESNRVSLNWNNVEYEKQFNSMRDEDSKLIKLLQMIAAGEYDVISELLEKNLKLNLDMAKKHKIVT